jgi:hypothetical protein
MEAWIGPETEGRPVGTGLTVGRSSVVGWGADKALWNEVVRASRSMYPFAEVARVAELVESEQLLEGGGESSHRRSWIVPEPVVEVEERVARST